MRSARRITPAESRVEAGVEVGREGPGATSSVAARIESIIKRRIEGSGRRGGRWGRRGGGGHVEEVPTAAGADATPATVVAVPRGTCCRDSPGSLRPRPDGSDTVILPLSAAAGADGRLACDPCCPRSPLPAYQLSPRPPTGPEPPPPPPPWPLRASSDENPPYFLPELPKPPSEPKPCILPAETPPYLPRFCRAFSRSSFNRSRSFRRSDICRLFSRTARRAAEASASQVRASAVAGSEAVAGAAMAREAACAPLMPWSTPPASTYWKSHIVRSWYMWSRASSTERSEPLRRRYSRRVRACVQKSGGEKTRSQALAPPPRVRSTHAPCRQRANSSPTRRHASTHWPSRRGIPG